MLERGSKTSTVKVSELNLDFYRREPNDFLSQMVTMDETWLYHYELEIKQQSILSEHGGSPWPDPKNSDCKFPLENFPTASIFGIKKASAKLITFQRAKHSTWSITHLCWCKWRTFWRKRPRKDHQVCLVLARQYPESPVTCNPEESGLLGNLVSWSPTLFSGSTICSLD